MSLLAYEVDVLDEKGKSLFTHIVTKENYYFAPEHRCVTGTDDNGRYVAIVATKNQGMLIKEVEIN